MSAMQDVLDDEIHDLYFDLLKESVRLDAALAARLAAVEPEAVDEFAALSERQKRTVVRFAAREMAQWDVKEEEKLDNILDVIFDGLSPFDYDAEDDDEDDEAEYQERLRWLRERAFLVPLRRDP